MLLWLKESKRLPTKPHFFTSPAAEAEDGVVNGEREGEIKDGKEEANGVSLVEVDDNDDDENLGLGLDL